MVARDVTPEICNQVPEVVLLLRSNGAVGEKDPHVPACKAADRVVHVYPGVHPLAGSKLGPGRPQLRRDHRALGGQRHCEGHREVLYWESAPLGSISSKASM